MTTRIHLLDWNSVLATLWFVAVVQGCSPGRQTRDSELGVDVDSSVDTDVAADDVSSPDDSRANDVDVDHAGEIDAIEAVDAIDVPDDQPRDAGESDEEAVHDCDREAEIAAGADPRLACMPTEYQPGFCRMGQDGYPQLEWAPQQICSDFRAVAPDLVVDCDEPDFLRDLRPPGGWFAEPTPQRLVPTVVCSLEPEYCPRVVRSVRLPTQPRADNPFESGTPIAAFPAATGGIWLFQTRSVHYLSAAGDRLAGWDRTWVRAMVGIPGTDDILIQDSVPFPDRPWAESAAVLGLNLQGIVYGGGIVRLAPDGTPRWRAVLPALEETHPSLVVHAERGRVFTFARTTMQTYSHPEWGVVGIAEIDLDTGVMVDCHVLPGSLTATFNAFGSGTSRLALEGDVLFGVFDDNVLLRYDLATREFRYRTDPSSPRHLTPIGDGTYLSGIGVELQRLDADLNVVESWTLLENETAASAFNVLWFRVLQGPGGQMFVQTNVGGLEFTRDGLRADPSEVLARTHRGGGAAYLADGTLLSVERVKLVAYAAGVAEPLWQIVPAVAGSGWALGVVPISDTVFMTGDWLGDLHFVEHVHGPLARSPNPLGESFDIYRTNAVPQGPFPEGPQWPRVWRLAGEGSGAEGSGG